MARPPSRVVGVILKGYPRLSETFILHEMLRLEHLGHALHIFALRNPAETTVHEGVRRMRAPVTYVPDYFWRYCCTFVWTNLRLWWSRPRLYWQAFRFAALRSLQRRSSSTIKRFAQAAYLVERGFPGTGVQHWHAHFSHGPTTVAFFASWLTGLPYSFSAHAKDIYIQEHDFLREKIRRAQFVVTCTEHNRQYLSRVAGDESRVFRVYHGVDLDVFQRAPVPASRPPWPVILSVGRFVPKKGFPVLLRALQQVRQHGHHFQCYIIGSGPLKQELRSLVHALSLADCVTLLPPMSQTALLEYYRQADVFALACEVQPDGDRDGIPNVVFEAMAMAIPVVCTDISGIPEVVTHGQNGLLVPEKDAVALADALCTLLEQPAVAAQLGQAGRTTVERTFDAQSNVLHISQLLYSAMLPHSAETSVSA